MHSIDGVPSNVKHRRPHLTFPFIRCLLTIYRAVARSEGAAGCPSAAVSYVRPRPAHAASLRAPFRTCTRALAPSLPAAPAAPKPRIHLDPFNPCLSRRRISVSYACPV
ncbi:jg27245 [Pararge aegeria aegeria]|uniref:Jg27245 protein n=1 Tax=Pararge aegeria aegeria TaxID=348720 RepID=A0A8S4RT68_9NEOP|nr:jg27245 [Pararge aegeria aegeria]